MMADEAYAKDLASHEANKLGRTDKGKDKVVTAGGLEKASERQAAAYSRLGNASLKQPEESSHTGAIVKNLRAYQKNVSCQP
jgi:hypothetical protein